MSSSLTTTRQAAPSRPRLPGVFSVGLSRARIELTSFFREKDAVIFIFAFPIILLLIFGSVFRDDVEPGVSFAQYFLPGMIAAGLMLVSFQSLAVQIAIERDDGTLKRLEGTPMPRSSYFAGKIGLVLVTALLQIVLLLVVARLVFDYRSPPNRRAG